MDIITVDGVNFRADTIPVFGANLLLIQGKKGMLGCGYLNLGTAEKLNHALAIVSGVKNYNDMLTATVKECSAAASALGVKAGMSGAEALKIMQ